MTLLRVDIDGTVRAIGRDPEVAVFAPGTSVEVGFSVPAPPSSFEFARVGPCIPGESCVAPIQPFRAGTVRMTAIPDGGAATSAEIVLEAGHRYVVAFTSLAGGELTPIDTAFDRSDASSARGRAFNTHVSGSPLTLGRLFGGNAQPIDGFVEIPSLAVSDEAVLPLGDWELVFALDGGPLGTGCFSSINTPAGWRGLVGVDEVLELDAWPPTTTRLFMACF